MGEAPRRGRRAGTKKTGTARRALDDEDRDGRIRTVGMRGNPVAGVTGNAGGAACPADLVRVAGPPVEAVAPSSASKACHAVLVVGHGDADCRRGALVLAAEAEHRVVASREALVVVGGRGAERVTGVGARAGGNAATGGAGPRIMWRVSARGMKKGRSSLKMRGCIEGIWSASALSLMASNGRPLHVPRQPFVFMRLPPGIFKFRQSRSDGGVERAAIPATVKEIAHYGSAAPVPARDALADAVEHFAAAGALAAVVVIPADVAAAAAAVSVAASAASVAIFQGPTPAAYANECRDLRHHDSLFRI